MVKGNGNSPLLKKMLRMSTSQKGNYLFHGVVTCAVFFRMSFLSKLPGGHPLPPGKSLSEKQRFQLHGIGSSSEGSSWSPVLSVPKITEKNPRPPSVLFFFFFFLVAYQFLLFSKSVN